jgi:transcriptional regulator with XRE-family HTH domain
MKAHLAPEQVAFAVARLKQLMDSRSIGPTELHRMSGVSQSHVSRILSAEQDPGTEVLETLFQSIGLRLNDVLNEVDAISQKMVGYLATPLTAVAGNAVKDKCVRTAVQALIAVAAEPEFVNPKFEIYWPGFHTHPTDNPEISPPDVYLIDRSRASSYDFVMLFCADASYGVGQENEIATQAGRPAIRLVPPSLSRMMTGSFLQALDVPYSGSLDDGITFNEDKLRSALHDVRRIHFKHRAYYRGIEQDGFGARLADLVKDHAGDYKQFAEDIGVALSYVLSMMNEPLIVSNPSSQLLLRMAGRLGVSVGYLLGESPDIDSIMSESKASWFTWLRQNNSLNTKVAVEIMDDWRDDYQRTRTLATVKSFRAIEQPVSTTEWDRRYQQKQRKVNNDDQIRLL